MIADVEAGVAVQAQPHAIQWDVNRWTHCRIKKSHGRIQSQLECHDRELRSFAELYVAARLCRWIDFTHWLIRGHRVMLIRSGSALGSAKGVRSQRRVPYRPGLDRRRFLLTSPLGVGRADAPRLRPRRAGVPPLWRAATVDRDGRGPEAIRAILGALGGWREREGRARPGAAQSRGGARRLSGVRTPRSPKSVRWRLGRGAPLWTGALLQQRIP